MRDAVKHITEAAKEITERMEEFKEEFQGLTEEILQATQDLAEKIADNTTERQDAPTQRMQQPTYAKITQQQTIPAAHITVITRGETSNKQILIQKDPNATDNVLDSLTKKDLVAKANTTLDLMGIEAEDHPTNTTFIRAKKLQNGSVLYQLNTKEAATWLRQPDVQRSFMSNYRGMSNICNKLFYVIAEFVPTTFDAGSTYTHARIEEDSALGTGTITHSRYTKPAHLRTNNQKVAHTIFGFNNRNSTNKV
jgi:vacuolar-type H+-ATPase subunit H